MSNENVSIIGFGTAGFNAAVALRTGGFEGTIDVFSNHDTLPYSPILTTYYAGGKKEYEECFPWSEEDVAELNLTIHNECAVTSLDTEGHTLFCGDESFAFDKCIIASGATPMTFGFPQDCGYTPYVMRTMDDAERLKEALTDENCHDVLISGASMVALKTLEACLSRGKNCTLVGMSEHVLDRNALPETAERFEKGLIAQGVNLRLGQTIRTVERRDDAGSSMPELEVTFSNGDTEVFDAITVAHGMRSNLDFIAEGSIDIDRAIVVDENMRTSNPDIYAAGDVAQALELVSGEKQVVGIWKNAAIQGACAGHAVASELTGQTPAAQHRFKGALPMNTIVVNNTLFISSGTIGSADPYRVETKTEPEMTVSYIYRKESDGSEMLVGFNICADNDEPGGLAYDTGAMLTMRIERACRNI